jgi:hypothetical protein
LRVVENFRIPLAKFVASSLGPSGKGVIVVVEEGEIVVIGEEEIAAAEEGEIVVAEEGEIAVTGA